jgi:hypothetical protein
VRKSAVVMIALVVGMLGVGAVAGAAVLSPTKVSAGVHKAKHPAYTYTTSGKITYPSKYCLPGQTAPNYCVALTNPTVCNGKVSLTVKLGSDALLAASKKTIARATGKVSSKCTYSITTKFKSKLFTAKHSFSKGAKGSTVKVSFAAKFLGNAVLNAKSARTQTITAKILP